MEQQQEFLYTVTMPFVAGTFETRRYPTFDEAFKVAVQRLDAVNGASWARVVTENGAIFLTREE